MPTCFVMQPFDRDKFDRRYEEIFKPAIIAAGLDPYRVDKDPGVSVPIDDIERGIRDSQICLAEITEDNPNVWFELGYAIACNKEVVLVCSKERIKFPFDIQHRTILRYETSSPSDFTSLKKEITAKVEAYLKKQEDVATSVAEIRKVTTSDGLEQHEIVAIAVIAATIEQPDDSYSVNRIKMDMIASGYTSVAATIALRSLAKQSYIKMVSRFDDEAQERFLAYALTEEGWEWVLANKNKFILKRPDPPPVTPSLGALYIGRS